MHDVSFTVVMSNDDVVSLNEGDCSDFEMVCSYLLAQVNDQISRKLSTANKARLDEFFHDVVMPVLSEDFAYASDDDAQAVIDYLAMLIKSIPVAGINVLKESCSG